ncbi:choice-of-anchor H family protein [Shewanella atlantica]|uniref:choice-of-anchor H family protein n=1 Tax=Shewanella atlantica TaxID=271099 RepID=UPI0037365ED0
MNSNSNMSHKKQNSVPVAGHSLGVNRVFSPALKSGVSIASVLSVLALSISLSASAGADPLNRSEVVDGSGLIQQSFSVGRETNIAQSTQAEGAARDSTQADNQLLQTLAQKKQQQLISGEAENRSKNRTREEVIAAHKSGQSSSKYARQKVAEATQFANPIFHQFSIYEASSRLFTDNDFDGFYQTFSVTFDADLIGFGSYERADVYAELYLSRNGGPWVHYYSTDIFTIIGDSADDDFEVLTTLHTGYPTDHYDVLIDLYEVGFDDIVATISSDDTDNLYALPLESSDRDAVYIGDSSSEGHGGGSLSLLGLLVLGCVSLKRRLF